MVKEFILGMVEHFSFSFGKSIYYVQKFGSSFLNVRYLSVIDKKKQVINSK